MDDDAKKKAMTMLAPLGTDEELVAAFRRYLTLRDRLLDEGDYIWFTVFKVADTEKRKAHGGKAEAEAAAAQLRAKKIECHVEKKIKKSGCRKLDKAFGISHEIVEQEIGPDYVRFVVRATAPNGQSTVQSGRCGRDEKGRQSSPMHHIEGTALTRAKNRASMDLLGGETTAEEVDEGAAEEPKPEPKRRERRGSKVAVPDEPAKPMTPKERLAEIDKMAETITAAPPVDAKQLIRKMFALAKRHNVDADSIKRIIKTRYGVESTKDMKPEALIEVIGALETGKWSDEVKA